MQYFVLPTMILSHIIGALYIQKQKYNKWVTACFWAAYAAFATLIVLFQENVIIGFFALLLVQAAIFFVTSIGSIGENTFLFFTYANSFCIYLGLSLILRAFIKNQVLLTICTFCVLILTHVFLYKIILPSYKKSKIFFSCGWWRLNIVLVFFMAQFVNQYAFTDVNADKVDFAVDFVIYSIIYYLTLILIFDTIKTTALMHRKEFETVELEKIAYLDVLTNIQSRVAYTKFTKKQVLNYRQSGISPSFVFVMLDIDGFKVINDTRGHAAGDEILKFLGNLINEQFKNFDCHSFRMGGDEFVLLFENKSISDIEDQVVKMNEKLYDSHEITLSYGSCEVDFGVEKPFEKAYKKADAIMYSCKEQKKMQN